jgi:hypothetical protein
MKLVEGSRSLRKDLFNWSRKEPGKAEGKGEAGVELPRLDRVDRLAGYPELFRKVRLAPVPLGTEKP